jgi:signal transduction histidine kinase
MSNAAKHAKASEITVEAQEMGGCLEVTVTDDGVGFDPSDVDSESHFGLSLIAERVKAASGRVDIRSALGRGTTVRASIPSGLHEKDPGP